MKISPSTIATKPIADVPFSQWTLPEKSTLNEASVNLEFEVLADGVPIDDTAFAVDGVMPKITVNTSNADAVVAINSAENPEGNTLITVQNPEKTFMAFKKIKYKSIDTKRVSVEGFVDLPIFSTEVSQTPEVANHKENMTDYDFGTRWTCMATGSTAIFDLGESKTVDAVAVAFWKGNVRSYYYDIYTSADGVNWTAAREGMSSSGTSEELELCEFAAPAEARYVKLVANGNSEKSAANANSNILEFRALKATK